MKKEINKARKCDRQMGGWMKITNLYFMIEGYIDTGTSMEMKRGLHDVYTHMHCAIKCFSILMIYISSLKYVYYMKYI